MREFASREQAAIKVGPANDRFEREADDVADRVMRGEALPTLMGGALGLQRKCGPCEDEVLRRKPLTSATTSRPAPSALGAGRPLPAAERAFFEPRFGYDFGSIRIHADARAQQSAAAVNARAYTLGRDIAFGAGEYRPGTSRGRRLLAHELAHVVQQARGESAGRVQRQTMDEMVAQTEATLEFTRAQWTVEAGSAPTSEERDAASISMQLLDAARMFGEMDGRAQAFRHSLWRYGRGTPSSRAAWQGTLRELRDAGFIERRCFRVVRGRPEALPASVTCHPLWESVILVDGRPTWVYPAWEPTIYDHPEVAAIRALGGQYVDAYWVGRYRGTQAMTRFDGWDLFDLLEGPLAAVGAMSGVGRRAVARALGMVGVTTRGLAAALRSARPFTRIIARLGNLRPIVSFARGARSALRALATARQWIGAQARLAVSITANMSLAAIRRLAGLGHAAIARIASLSTAAKRVLLGCMSPCRVDIAVIRAFLDSPGYSATQRVLTTVDDVIGALPPGINSTSIRRYLNRHPAIVTFIEEAGLSAADFQVLAGFIRTGASARVARQTFTRFLTQLIPARVTRITDLNRIADAAIAVEPRIASAMKGPMFEAWSWHNLADFRGVGRARLRFPTSTPGLTISQTRSFDGWVSRLSRVYEMKHTMARVPQAQVRDYLRILAWEARQATPRFTEIVYIFQSRAAAAANRHLLSYASEGISVRYVSPAGRLLQLR